MDGDTIYWDDFLLARVIIHTASPDGVSVTLLDEPGVQLEQWGDIRPTPGAIVWTSWCNLKPLVLH